jgi:predicted DNA-binding protein
LTPRTGRPPIEDPKDISVRIRLSDADNEKLEYCRRITGKAKAEIIREGIDKIYQELIQKQ